MTTLKSTKALKRLDWSVNWFGLGAPSLCAEYILAASGHTPFWTAIFAATALSLALYNAIMALMHETQNADPCAPV